MSTITSHVLDQSRGTPAAGVKVTLQVRRDGAWHSVGTSISDGDGRVRDLLPTGQSPMVGEYRLSFATGEYFAAAGIATFYPQVTIAFDVADATQHYHVPLLLGPWGYTTYRGS